MSSNDNGDDRKSHQGNPPRMWPTLIEAVSSYAAYWRAKAENPEKPQSFDISFWTMVTGIGTCIAAILAGVAAFVFWCQLRVSQDAEQRQLRAYVGQGASGGGLDYVPPEQKFSVRSRMVNTGLTPAFRLSSGATVKIFPYPVTEKLLRQIRIPMHIQDMTIFPQQFTDVVGKYDISISQSELKAALADKNNKIYSFGTVTYTDAFGAPHWAHFCASLSANIDVSQIQIGEKNSDGIIAEACPFWNDSD